MEHDIKDEILRKLMHHPGMTFNELWGRRDCEVRSNNFAYHLKLMSSEELIEKKVDKYYLSSKGKSLAVFIDGQTGKKEKQPLLNIVMVIYDGDKMLLHQRLKEPFYGYYGFPGAKLKFGEAILDCARRELKEETNLECDLELKGIMNVNTYNDDVLSYHNTQFIVKCINPRGILKGDDREGTFSWATKEEILSKKRLFADIPFILQKLEEDIFFTTEAQRFQENHEFVNMKFMEVNEYDKRIRKSIDEMRTMSIV